MVADTKKVQSLINRCGDAMVAIRAQIAVLEDYRDRFQAADPDLAGTPFAGQGSALATMSASIDTLRTEANRAVWTALIAAKVPTHRGGGL